MTGYNKLRSSLILFCLDDDSNISLTTLVFVFVVCLIECELSVSMEKKDIGRSCYYYVLMHVALLLSKCFHVFEGAIDRGCFHSLILKSAAIPAITPPNRNMTPIVSGLPADSTTGNSVGESPGEEVLGSIAAKTRLLRKLTRNCGSTI